MQIENAAFASTKRYFFLSQFHYDETPLFLTLTEKKMTIPVNFFLVYINEGKMFHSIFALVAGYRIHALKYFIILAIISIWNNNCKPPELEGLCDTSSKSFEKSAIVRTLIGDKSDFCGFRSSSKLNNSITSTPQTSLTSLTYPTGISYFKQSTTIADITPVIVGGTPTTCISSPALPTGLSLNQSTCVISGTPIVGTSLSTYTITASNALSSVTGTTTFKVDFSGPKFVYFGNFTSNDISQFSINVATGALTSLGASSALGGARKGRDLSPDPLGRFLFSATFDGGDVGSQPIQATGTLSTRSLVAQANNSESITVDPTGKFVYSVGTTGSFVASYTVNQTTGVLTFVNSVATGLTSRWIRVHPYANFAYVMDGTTGSECVRVYSINSSTGSLTVSSQYNLTAAGTPEQLVIHPNGNFLYSSDRTASKFRKFDLNSTTGVLSGEVVTSALPFGPEHLVISPSGKYLYVAGQSSTTIRLYNINQATGALTFVIDFTATNNVSDMVIDSSENFLVVSNFGSNLYQVLRVSAIDGTLTSIASGSTGGSGANTIAITGSN